MTMTKTGFLGSSAIAAVALNLASPAWAEQQDRAASAADTAQPANGDAEAGDAPAPPPADNNAQAGDNGAIVVTGSRIRRPNLESTVPITSVSGEEFFQTGDVSVGDTLNQLPSLHSTFSQSNSTRFLGTAGLNLLDLRGLGTQRTLVLVNGRRHVGGDILGSATSVDINTIPTDLIQRVDVVTGGNSAIYGSDAIAGVVNFVLRQDYQGIQVRGQGGISTYGDMGSYFGSLLWGTNFADGRGNVTVNLEYARQDAAYASGRPNLRVNSRWVTVDTDTGARPSDGVVDNIFVRDTRFPFFNNGGDFAICCSTGPNGQTFLPIYLFQPDGTLVPQTGQLIGTDFFGERFVGGNGSTAREGKLLILQPQLDRYSANLVAHFTVSDAFVPFVEATFSRTNSRGSTSGPFFISGSTTGSPREHFFTQNPFLNPQARQFISDYYGVPTSANVPFSITRSITDLGVRDEAATRDTYRIVGGIRGTFNEDWSYEVSANYGELDERTKVLGNVDVQRFLLAIDAVRDPASGNIVCRSTINPAARIAFENAVDPAAAQAALAADVAACVPANVFGEGNLSQAARDYILEDTVSSGRITQFVANAFLSGDTSQWFSLPGGPVGFALGAEYRRETNFFRQDPLVQAGLTFYNSIPSFTPPAFEVKELFGELRLPILRDTPFFDQLTISAAARLADYRGDTGTVYAYNAGIDWSPIRDIHFRANYSRAVRAPNLTDLYTPLGQNFAPGFQDPCAANQIGTGSQFRAANCAAAGIPAGFNYVYPQSLQIQSGGNPNLNAETSDSFTVGGVAQPRFIPGLSISVDYFDIRVNDVITAPTAQQIVDACYDLENPSNQFCSLFQRNRNAAPGPFGEQQFRILEGSLQQTSLNYAKLQVRGIDAEIAYRHRIGSLGTLNTRFTYTHNFQNDQFLDPTDPGFADQLLLELSFPEDQFEWNVDFVTGPIQLHYKMRYVGRMTTFAYENIFSKQGRPPENSDVADINFFPAVFYHDIRIGANAGERFNFYVGVDNLLNRLPPYGLTGVGGGSGIYSNRGRFFYTGISARF
jgi:outer membrane receptor protein involved in Fe transport